MTDIGIIVFGVACLLAAFSLLVPIARYFNLPYTVALALFGILIGLALIGQGGEDKIVSDLFSALQNLRLPADGYLYLFLPPLLFAAGLSIDIRRLIDELGPIILMAVVAVVVCSVIVGIALSLTTEFSFVACLLLGSIVATTDSAAVLAIFRDLGAPKRLLVLVEGESLFNDAAAIAFYAVLFAIVSGSSDPGVIEGIWTFFVGLIGGAMVGYVFARACTFVIGYMRDVVMAEVTLSVALAYITFFVAEANLGVSGVIAVVIASMTFASQGRTVLSPGAWGVLRGTWRILDFWATSLIFILAAMIVPQALSTFEPGDFWIILNISIATLVARYLVLYGLVPILSSLGIADKISGDYKKVIWWGGLRGAVTIALALAVTESPNVPADVGQFILVGATGYVLVTLLLQAPTLRGLMRLLNMNKLTARELQVKERVRQVSQTHVKEQVAKIADDIGYRQSLVAKRQIGIDKTEPEDPLVTSRGPTEPEMSKADRLQVALLAIASRENELYFEYLQKGIVSRRVLQLLLAHSSRMIDGAKSAGIEGYKAASYSGLRWSASLHAALWAQRRFGFKAELELLLAERFEALLIIEIALHELRHFSETTMQELLGQSTTDSLREILEDRLASVAGALEAVELQFPAFAEGMHRGYLSRVALGFEEVQYRQQLAQSVISPEVYEELEAERRLRQKDIEIRPHLDLGLKLSQMLSKVPLFAALDPGALSKVAHQLKPRLGMPGQRIIRRGEIGRHMYFIVSGAVIVHLPDGDIRISAGDFVGEMSIVTNRPRSADVIVDGYCHLLRLDRRDFRRICRSNPDIREHIERTTQERLKNGAEFRH
jgi:CPA1 family monovalent cation:H+ antiporter